MKKTPLNIKKKLSVNLKSSAYKIVSTLSLCLIATLPVQAAEWSSSNIQFLAGGNYALGNKNRNIITYENSLGWKYGDSFLFIDVTDPTSKGTSYYSEFSPRFSLSKITGKKFSNGIIKDVMVATTLEMGQGVRGYLVGVGLPLNLPGFAFANVNVYARKSERDFATQNTNTGGQLSISWNRPFSIGSSKLNFEGFADYAFGESGGSNPKEDNLIAAPSLMLNLGKSIQVGVEHQIWRNKFGIKGVDENVTQAKVKWTF